MFQMAKSSNQKTKLLFLMKYLLEATDEMHPASLADLLAMLERHGIRAERKSIYDDLEALRLFGLDIEFQKAQPSGYYVASRSFELPELKLLVDAVQSSKFITHKKTSDLIKKIESLASIHQASQLQRQVYVSNRAKTMNESIYYNVDAIHSAIAQNRKIQFKYFEWTVEKKKLFRHSGKLYSISPWALTWDDENYYMVGYDQDAGILKHYRVDKMTAIEITPEKRDGQDRFEQMDMAVYTKKLFGMFGGDEEDVKLEFDNSLASVIIDRFGQDVPLVKTDESHFSVRLKVAVSPQFLSWVFGFGARVRVISPESVKESLRAMCGEVARLYAPDASTQLDRESILGKLKSLYLPAGSYVVTAGAALVLYGLRETTRDLDLGCSKALAAEFINSGCNFRWENGRRVVEAGNGIELLEDWIPEDSTRIEGFPVASLQSIRQLKESLGREKDWEDIRRIDQLLAEQKKRRARDAEIVLL